MRQKLIFLLVLALLAPLAGKAQIQRTPKGWQEIGKVEGLKGDTWHTRKTRYTVCLALEEDLAYVDPIVSGLDESFQVNARFMGFQARSPLKFYFFPMTDPAHTQPRFSRRLSRMTQAAGVALTGNNECVINLGSQKYASPFQPWEVEATSRHEMNHLFAFQLRGSDRLGSWGWLYEALAEHVENTVLPPSAQMSLKDMKGYMKGYTAQDASWAAMVAERDNDQLEQYRDYEKLLASIIFFFEGKYGRGSIARLMSAARGQDLEDALIATFGKGAEGLEQEWKSFYSIR